MKAIDLWKHDFTANQFFSPAVRPDQIPMLRQAASELRAALEPAGAHVTKRMLMALRSSTTIKRESLAEADATMRKLVEHLCHIPADILANAFDAYCRAPGDRYFPKSAGQIIRFAGAALFLRQQCSVRFPQMADQAQAELDEQARIKAGNKPIPRDEIAAANELMARVGAKTRYGKDGLPIPADPR